MKRTKNETVFFPKAELDRMSKKDIDKLSSAITDDIVESDTTYTFHVGGNAFTLEIQKMMGGVRVSLFRNYNMHLSDFIASRTFKLDNDDDMLSSDELLLRSVYTIKHGFLGDQAKQLVG